MKKIRKKPTKQQIEIVASNPEDIVSQFNMSTSSKHGLGGGASLFSAAAAGREDTLHCFKKSHTKPMRVIVRVAPKTSS